MHVAAELTAGLQSRPIATQLSKKDAALIARLRVDRRYDLAARVAGLLIGRGLKWGFFAFLVWEARQAIEALAGRTTLTSLILSLGTDVKVVAGVSWAASLALGIWVFLERRLRKGITERLTVRIKDLELQIDRKRSSSELTARGDTRPEDQL